MKVHAGRGYLILQVVHAKLYGTRPSKGDWFVKNDAHH